MLYIFILILLGFFYVMNINKLRVKESVDSNKTRRSKKVYILLCSMVLIFFAGMRSVEVGADTNMYKTLFDYASLADSFSNGYNSWQRGGVEIGYYVFEYFFAKHYNFQLFLFVVAVISIAPVMVVIYRYSSNYYYSIFLYIAFGYFSFAMNGIRQAMAIGICMIAYIFYRERKLCLFLLTIIFACFFHKSAILFFPVYWIGKIPKEKKNIYIFLGALVAVFIFRSRLFVLLNMFSRQQYLIASNQGGLRMFLVMFITAMIGWVFFYRYIIKQNESGITQKTGKENWHLLMMISVAVGMWPIANVNAELNRMYYYYHIFLILYVPSVTSVLHSKEKFIINSAYIVVASYYLYSYIINGALKYSPYFFYWE